MDPRSRVLEVLKRRRLTSTDILMREAAVSLRYLHKLREAGDLIALSGHGRRPNLWTMPDLTATIVELLEVGEASRHTAL